MWAERVEMPEQLDRWAGLAAEATIAAQHSADPVTAAKLRALADHYIELISAARDQARQPAGR